MKQDNSKPKINKRNIWDKKDNLKQRREESRYKIKREHDNEGVERPT